MLCSLCVYGGVEITKNKELRKFLQMKIWGKTFDLSKEEKPDKPLMENDKRN